MNVLTWSMHMTANSCVSTSMEDSDVNVIEDLYLILMTALAQVYYRIFVKLVNDYNIRLVSENSLM